MSSATNEPAATPSLRDRLGWRAERRPVPGFGHMLAAVAGAFAVAAIVAVAVEVASDDITAPGVLFTLALAIAAFVAGTRFPGPARSAAITAITISVPLVWIFAFVGDGDGGTGDARGIYLLSIAAYTILYVFGGWAHGRAVLLALMLVFTAGWILFEVDGTTSSVVPFQEQVQPGLGTPFGEDGTGFEEDDPFDGDTEEEDPTTTGAVSFAIGLALLGTGALLDRRRLVGAATPFIATGALFGIVGAIVLGADDSVLTAGFLAAGTGAAVGLVGGLGESRRATTWIGGLTVLGGLAAVAGDLAGESILGFAGLAALMALGLGALGVVASRRLGEPVDGDAEAGNSES
jgi:hypothetical protein